MDITTAELVWPDRPYRGLDYYREADAPLFRERDDEVRKCTQILHGFGLKILLLHGSSGSGKSSFLRAGLIPALKQDRRSAVFFLAGYDSVIRATSDPLAEVARVVLAALRGAQVFADGALVSDGTDADDSPLHVAQETRETISRSLEQALHAPRRELGKALIGALGLLCAGLPGRLMLVLDQAEEVLTRTADGLAEAKATAFFRFIEDIYIRNLDIRLIVTLRTEYYGRFRDELRISDDRLADRPSKGGIEQFLLRSLRDKDALVRIVEAPTLARQASGAPFYGFWFEGAPPTGGEGHDLKTLPSRIADELLQEFPASVTPALQVICASLHQRLPAGGGPITHAAYAATGGVRKIILRYIAKGIEAAGARRADEIAKWQSLLHSLVSRQGGGTVVSLTEQGCELERRARRFGIAGDIGSKLIALTSGTEPLLKGEPCCAPTSFSLKHDMLAVVLSRWNDEYSGVSATRASEKRKRNRILAAGALAILLVGCTGAALIGSRTHALAQAEAENIRLKNTYAERAPNGNYRRSLLLLLANLKATSEPRGFYDKFFAGSTMIHDETASVLRRFLPRAPWFSGEYAAVGLDPDGAALAMLRSTELTVIRLPKHGVVPEATSITYPLVPPTSASDPSGRMQYAAGFVTGLGPAAAVNDTVYFWPGGDGKLAEVRHLPVRRVEGMFPPRIDFVGGRLQIMWRHPSQPAQILQLGADALKQSDDDLAKLVDRTSAQPVQAKGGWGRPIAALSEAVKSPQRYATLEEPSRRGPQADELGEPQLLIGSLDGSATLKHALEARQPSQEPSGRYDATLAFASNADALAVKKDGLEFAILDFASRHTGRSAEGPAVMRVTIDADADEMEWRLGQASNTSQYPPLAVVKMGQHWRAAGLGTKGVWVVESTDDTPGKASMILGGQLPGGEEGGAKLQFTADGKQLMLVQQRQFGRPATVRLWDLRKVWRDWLDPPDHASSADNVAADMATVQAVACRIVRAERQGGAIDATQGDLFQIAPAFREPCPDTKGAPP